MEVPQTMNSAENYCIKMILKKDREPIRGKSPVYMFGKELLDEAANWVEIMTVTDDFMMMEGTSKDEEKIVHIGPDGHKGGPYPKWIHNADKTFFFYGTDPDHPEDLGAHVEFHLGEGEEEQILSFEEPRAVFVPKGLRHGPVYVNGFRKNLIIFSVLGAPSREDAGIVTDFDYVADEAKLSRK